MSKKLIYVTGLLILIAIISCVFVYYSQNAYYSLWHPQSSFKLSGKTSPSKKIMAYVSFADTDGGGYIFKKHTKSNEDGYYEMYLKPGDYTVGFEDGLGVGSCYFVSGSFQPRINDCDITVTDKDLVINISPDSLKTDDDDFFR